MNKYIELLALLENNKIFNDQLTIFMSKLTKNYSISELVKLEQEFTMRYVELNENNITKGKKIPTYKE